MGTLRETFGVSDRRAARDAAQQAALRAFTLSGPGGSSFGFDPTSGTGRINLGDLSGIRSLLLDGSVGRLLQGGGASPLLNGTAAGALADLGAPDFSSFNFAAPELGSLGRFTAPQLGALPQFMAQQLSAPRLGRAAQITPQMLQGMPGLDPTALSLGRFSAAGGVNFDQGLEGTLRDAALSNLGILNTDPFELASGRLDLLREQSQPFEQRAFTRLQDNLFATGRLGSTGGGLQTEAFARGLGQADLERQIASTDFARSLQSDAQGRLTSLLGQGRETTALQEALSQGQFGRSLAGFETNLGAATGEFDRNLAAGFGSFDRNLASRLGVFDANQRERFGSFDRNQQAGLDTFDRNLAAMLGVGELGQSERFGAFDRNLGALFGGFDRSLAGAETQFGQNMAAKLAEFESSLAGRTAAFDRNLGVAGLQDSTRAQRALERFGIARELFGTSMNADQQRFGQALSAIGTATGIDANALQQFMAALQTEQARSGARLGGSQTLAQLGTNPIINDISRFMEANAALMEAMPDMSFMGMGVGN